MTQLYKLTGDLKELEKLSDEGVDIADTVEAIEGEFNDKAVAVITVSENMESDVTALDNEIKRLTERKRIIKNRQNGMREYLRSNMESVGITKIQCPLFTITLKKGRDIVQIDNADKIPTDYIEFSTVERPMKKEILADLKEGKDIAGCTLVKSKTSLIIK